ncbi:transposase family protein [Streptomyces sp. SID13726]|nr:transposase family protein [Streptomyces sp. SID13726]
MLSDNRSAYRSHTWRDACPKLGIKHRRTRPYRKLGVRRRADALLDADRRGIRD